MGVRRRRGDPPRSEEERPLHVGVVGAPGEWLSCLRAGLGRRAQLTSVPDLSSLARVSGPAAQWDVALAFMSARSLGSLTDVLGRHAQLGFPEIVAVAEHANDPAAAALRELGVDRV